MKTIKAIAALLFAVLAITSSACAETASGPEALAGLGLLETDFLQFARDVVSGGDYNIAVGAADVSDPVMSVYVLGTHVDLCYGAPYTQVYSFYYPVKTYFDLSDYKFKDRVWQDRAGIFFLILDYVRMHATDIYSDYAKQLKADGHAIPLIVNPYILVCCLSSDGTGAYLATVEALSPYTVSMSYSDFK